MMDEQSRKVPLSMSMDLALLRRLDALRGQTTRSAFVRSIITEYVDAREPEVKGQRKLTDRPGD
jgi:metal-responsive CopG/Arc/MetJ family transcriptional regulator